MSDKILTEAFDKLKAIEESDDPFCIGATKEEGVAGAYTEVDEAAIGQGNIRDEVIDALDEGLIDKEYLITAMLNYMSTDDVADMLRSNDINLMGYEED